jgi:hypothetical protein
VKKHKKPKNKFICDLNPLGIGNLDAAKMKNNFFFSITLLYSTLACPAQRTG